jgi:hypothetical protein
MKIHLHRYRQDYNQTLGTLSVIAEDGSPITSMVSLERGWRHNRRGVSCVPKGEYEIVLEYSPRFRMMLWELKGVPDRSEIKIHAANYWSQLNGCIGVGLKTGLINDDNYRDVLNSKLALKRLHLAMGGAARGKIIITSEDGIF